MRRTTPNEPGLHRLEARSPLLPVARRVGAVSVVATASIGGLALAHGHLERAVAAAPAVSTPQFAAVSQVGAGHAPSPVRSQRVTRSLAETDGPAVVRLVHEASFAPDHLVKALPGCPPPVSTEGYENGRLPDDALCTLPDGQRLRSDAAAAWVALDAAFTKAFGSPIVVTDSYRPLEVQVKLKKVKPVLAAVPGTSQHGWGIAVDLGGGIQTLGSEQHDWMLEHAHEYGWDNPDWARPGGSKLEPWHWEYTRPGQAATDVEADATDS